MLLAAAIDDNVLMDRCDVIEINHIVSRSGKSRLDQVIFWDLGTEGDYEVVDWRLMQGCRRVDKNGVSRFIGGHATPRRHGTRWRSFWFDNRSESLREVTSTAYCETWTTWDPEIEHRSTLPADERRKLRERGETKLGLPSGR